MVTGTGVHTLLFRWLCCVTKQQRLQLAAAATGTFWKLLDTMERWAERSGDGCRWDLCDMRIFDAWKPVRKYVLV